MKTISIAKQFSPNPAGRYPEDGPFNGERFRQDFLIPALNDSDVVTVVLDGVSGFGSSFLEEAFGGLIRKHLLDKSTFKDRLIVEYNKNNSDLAFYADLINEFMQEAEPE